MLCMNFSTRNNAPVALPKKAVKMQPTINKPIVRSASLMNRLLLEKPTKCGSCGGAK